MCHCPDRKPIPKAEVYILQIPYPCPKGARESIRAEEGMRDIAMYSYSALTNCNTPVRLQLVILHSILGRQVSSEIHLKIH